MTDFDPNHDPETEAEANAYINWCAQSFNHMVTDETPETWATARQAAGWLWVWAQALQHLDSGVEDHEAMLRNMATLNSYARQFERRSQFLTLNHIRVARSMLDAWEPVGEYARPLLAACKCATSALLLCIAHPLEELSDMEAPDGWALVLMGGGYLEPITRDERELTPEHFAIRPSEDVVNKMQDQRVRNMADRFAGPDAGTMFSPN